MPPTLPPPAREAALLLAPHGPTTEQDETEWDVSARVNGQLVMVSWVNDQFVVTHDVSRTVRRQLETTDPRRALAHLRSVLETLRREAA